MTALLPWTPAFAGVTARRGGKGIEPYRPATVNPSMRVVGALVA